MLLQRIVLLIMIPLFALMRKDGETVRFLYGAY